MRHEQQLGIVAFELGNRLARELVRAHRIDAPDDRLARCRGHSREKLDRSRVGGLARRTGGPARLIAQQPVERAESCHDSRKVPDIAGAAHRHIEDLRIARLQLVDDLGQAHVRAPIVQLARDTLTSQRIDTR